MLSFLKFIHPFQQAFVYLILVLLLIFCNVIVTKIMSNCHNGIVG